MKKKKDKLHLLVDSFPVVNLYCVQAEHNAHARLWNRFRNQCFEVASQATAFFYYFVNEQMIVQLYVKYGQKAVWLHTSL
jgi:hypothetical protein